MIGRLPAGTAESRAELTGPAHHGPPGAMNATPSADAPAHHRPDDPDDHGGAAGGASGGAASGGAASGGGRDDGEFAGLSAPLAEFAATNREDPRWEVLRDQLIAGFLPLAQRIARRFARRGEPVDDLAQVATLGLIRALDHYDPEYGPAFLPYAVPTIVGEIRRHFRDQGWGVRVPRRLKDLYVSIGAAVEKLGTQLGRAPRPSELAAHLNLTVEEVLEGLDAAHAYRTESLDKVLHTDEGGTSLSDLLGCPDPDLELVDYHETLQPLLAALPNRERTILMMRFFGNMTQRQIADRVGISQMHVSRVLDATLSRLRHELLDG